MMKTEFYEFFKSVVQTANISGIYMINCEKIYRWRSLMKVLIHLSLFVAVVDIILLSYAIFSFLLSGKEALGLTKYYISFGLGTVFPSYVRVVYANIRRHDLKQIVDIWDKDLCEPPYPKDRDDEMKLVQKSMSSIVKIQMFCFVLPLMVWSSRSIVTKEEIVPTGFPGNHCESPIFELITMFMITTGFYMSSVWAGFEAIQILVMKSTIAELNHLNMALHKILDIVKEDDTILSGLVLKPKYDLRNLKYAEIRKMMRTWIRHHQNVLKFNKASNEFFGPVLLLHNMATITFAFTCVFVAIMGELKIDNRIELIGYMLFYLYVLFKSCTWGDDIEVKSTNITEPFREKLWYLYTKDIIKTILIIQQVTLNRPVRLKASGFRTLSRRTFAELTQKGYEIITFMSHFIGLNRG